MDNQIDKKYWQFLNKFRIMFSLFCFFIIFFFFTLYAIPVANAAGFIVNSIDDPGDGNCTPDHCTLHEAISSANTNPGKDQITFNIPGSAPFTIHLTVSLPKISYPLVIDGSTQPGFAGSPIIELDGSHLNGPVNGLEITGGDSLIRGLVINGFRGKTSGNLSHAIFIQQMGGNTVQGCYLGTDITGTEAVTNSVTYDPLIGEGYPGLGIGILYSSNNLIGGSQPGEGNLISGNLQGIRILYSIGNSIQGNNVGTDITGTDIIGNGIWFLYKGEFVVYDSSTGINIVEADNTLVGGAQLGARNIISGNRVGIEITDSKNFEILGNYIGTDIEGILELGNDSDGINIYGKSKVDLGQSFIGGSTVGAGNLISGNESGVRLFTEDGVALNGIKIFGNKIGTDYTGTHSIPNRYYGGIYLDARNVQPMDIMIGGDQPGEGNLISGNEGPGISVSKAAGVIINGNIIGTDITGSVPLGNSSGIALVSGASDNLIGEGNSGASNLISGNEKYGVYIQGDQNQIYNNRIGTDYLGGSAISNGFDGVIILDGENNQIGGISPAEKNLISSNQRAGVFLSGSGSMLNSVQGNQIGTDLAGNANLGNLYGVLIDGGSNNLIGGYEDGAANQIVYSGQHGVWIKSGYGNSIISNQISGSVGLGIELSEDGITPNDPGDVDTGANDLQNYPLFSSVASGSDGTTISGELNSESNRSYVLQFFFNTSCNPSGHGEGETFLTSSSVLTDENGNASFTIHLPEVVSVGGFLTATATSPTFDTSEFSACVPVVWANSPPEANPNGPPIGAVNTPIPFDGTGSSDPDNDLLSYKWEFGDGSPPVSGTTPSHIYKIAGIYDVCLTVNDGYDDSDQVCTIVVVYDPNAGFVTGGGWIESPAEAYKPDPSLTGKATFGFVSNYKKGADQPEGNTEFQFNAGDLNFHSDHYKWLVVTGSNDAKFMGKGTINGEGIGDDLYRFQIWAGDNDPDTFRIKIWYEDNGAEIVVYDNGMNQEIGGGSIVIHTKK
jgi:hypothetical protein